MSVLSSVRLLDPEKIVFHEPIEPRRLEKTLSAIRKAATVNHPPIATPLENGRYLLLDGAHRTHALKRLGCLRIPVQVVEPDRFRITAWEHLVPSGSWLERLKSDPGLAWSENPPDDSPIAEITESTGSVSFGSVPSSHKDRPWIRLDCWHRIVDAYNGSHAVRRHPRGSCVSPEPGTVLIRYPAWDLDGIKKVVTAYGLFPAGVTRFLVDGRLLQLKVPLSMLMTPTWPAREWTELCETRTEKLRLYTESVYLCEV